MKFGPVGEIYLESLGYPRDVLIPVDFAHTKKDITRYIRARFSHRNTKILLAELRGKKVLRKPIHTKKKRYAHPISKVSTYTRNHLLKHVKNLDFVLEDFANQTQFDSSFSEAETYLTLFNSPIQMRSLQSVGQFKINDPLENYIEDLQMTEVLFEAEMQYDSALHRSMLIAHGTPEKLERSGSVTYKKLLKNKKIPNREHSPLTKTDAKILRSFENGHYILGADLYSRFSDISMGAILKSLRKMVQLHILNRSFVGRYNIYRRVIW